MTNNMELWDKVATTDPKYTKKVTFGRSFTAIDPMYQVMKATEVLGVAGQGWGFELIDKTFLPTDYIALTVREAAAQMKALGIGVSTSVGIGGDPVNGSSFRDILELFEADPDTDAVMMIGEIGGPQEAEAADYIRTGMTKPVVAYVAGLSAPKGKRMGHAGAIISAFGESAPEKVEILQGAGVTVAPNPSELGTTMAQVLSAYGAASI